MKKLILKPGFEFIFSLSLIAVLALPPALLAQNNKDTEIKITNGDTTINGKSIKSLSAADKKEALKEINHIASDIPANQARMNDQVFLFKSSKDSANAKVERIEIRKRRSVNDGDNRMLTGTTIIKDSLGNITSLKSGADRPARLNLRYRSGDVIMDRNEWRNNNMNDFSRGSRFERKNSQNFEYVTTDNEGISIHVRFFISEVSNDDLKKMPHVEGGRFEISDLNLVPEFSTGKTLLMFNLPSKTLAVVKLTDSEGKLLFDEKTTGGNFIKTFALGLNGIYYLQVKQGNNIAVKKIVKEE